MKKKFGIILTDDWELKGNGTGRVTELQKNTSEKFISVCKKHNVKASFMIEVMQQIAFEKYASKYKEIETEKNIWEKSLKNIINEGFDIQLHIHPHWREATYDGTKWKLGNSWNIADYSKTEIEDCIAQSISYLNNFLVCSKNQDSISVFRGGAWGVCCPSNDLFRTLEENGIRFDISLVNDHYFDGDSIKLDYLNLESPFFPYYPNYDDVRTIANNVAKIIEIPTQTICINEFDFLTKFYLKNLHKYIKYFKPKILFAKLKSLTSYTKPGINLSDYSVIEDPWGYKSQKAKGESSIYDISKKDSLLFFKRGIDFIIARAEAENTDKFIPLVLACHTKNIDDESIRSIDKLLEYIITNYSDCVEFITLSELINCKNEIYIKRR